MSQLQSGIESAGPAKIQCTGCREPLGVVDATASGWRLYKWDVDVRPSAKAAEEIYPIEVFVSSYLLELIDNQAVRKFVVHCEDELHPEGIVVSSVFWMSCEANKISASYGFLRQICNTLLTICSNQLLRNEL